MSQYEDQTESAQNPSGETSHPARPGRGRRPAGEVRDAILTAAGRLLFEKGVSALTAQRVAAMSGASRATIHKWWPSRGALAFDAYRASVADVLMFPNSGDVEADLRAQLHAFIHLVTQTEAGKVYVELIGLAQADPELRFALIEQYANPRRMLAMATMRRGQAQGQLRNAVDVAVVVDQLWGACYHRMINSELPVTAAFADALIDNVWHGIAVAERALSGRRGARRVIK